MYQYIKTVRLLDPKQLLVFHIFMNYFSPECSSSNYLHCCFSYYFEAKILTKDLHAASRPLLLQSQVYN